MFVNTTQSFRSLIAGEIRFLSGDNSYFGAELTMRKAQFDSYFRTYPHLFLNRSIREIAKRIIAVASLSPDDNLDEFLDGRRRYEIYAGK